MWLTSKLISECTANSNSSTNYGDNKNGQDNENHPDNKINITNRQTNTYSKPTIEKKFWSLYG